MSTAKKNYCGTQYGYRLHKKRVETVCEPCRSAMNNVNTRSRKNNHAAEVERHRRYRAEQKKKEAPTRA